MASPLVGSDAADPRRGRTGVGPSGMTTAAVIGCGDVSVVHFEALSTLAGVRLVAVCDVDAARAAEAGARYGVPWFTDHRQLLAEAQPDVVQAARCTTSMPTRSSTPSTRACTC